MLVKLYCNTVGIVIDVRPHNFNENQNNNDDRVRSLAPRQQLTELTSGTAITLAPLL
jgi:hypothetical protein